MKKTHRILFVVALTLIAASAAEAAIFTVTLANGTSFDTRYRPVEADWDSSVVMIRTDRGNWIALKKSEVTDVVSQIEQSGFGYQLNTTTLFLGWTPNDLGPEGEGDVEGGNGGGGDASSSNAQPYTYGDEGSNQGFTLEQFVDIPDEGSGIGGVGLGGTSPSGEPNG